MSLREVLMIRLQKKYTEERNKKQNCVQGYMLNRIKKWTWHGCAILSVVLMLICATGLTACFKPEDTVQNSVSSNETIKNDSGVSDYEEFASSLDTLPEYSGNPYIVVNDNTPFFTEADKTTASFEQYGELDSLGRCTTAYANVGKDLMPTEKRGSIGSVKPTGWQTAKYDNVDGKYLYNRCHLIGYQLTAENANKKNLITGTRYLNVNGMLPFENMVADYIKETNNHVLYRVTPVFIGDNLVASGVLMEAESVEDNGEGILFNVYCYNVQPGIVIDYATGDSHQ